MKTYLPDTVKFRRYLLGRGLALRTATEFTTAYRHILNRCPRLNSAEIAAFYADKEKQTTRIFYFFALRKVGEFYGLNLNDRLDYVRQRKKRAVKSLAIDDMQNLIMAHPMPHERPYKALLLLLLATGLRISEALSIQAEDFSSVLSIRGKGDHDRQIYIDPIAFESIRKVLHGRLSGPIFRFNRNSAYVGIRNYGRRLGVAIYPHMLRHTFASEMLKNGVDLKIIQDILGHSSLATTERYLSVDPQRKMAIYLQANPLARSLNTDASKQALISDLSPATPKTQPSPMSRQTLA